MRTLGIVLALSSLLTACAMAQSNLNPDFSKAALKFLAASNTPVSAAVVDAAQADAEAAATSATEDAVLEQIKTFKKLRYMGPMRRLHNSGVTGQVEADAKMIAEQDAACYQAWRTSLRELSPIQPAACVAMAAMKIPYSSK